MTLMQRLKRILGGSRQSLFEPHGCKLEKDSRCAKARRGVGKKSRKMFNQVRKKMIEGGHISRTAMGAHFGGGVLIRGIEKGKKN